MWQNVNLFKSLDNTKFGDIPLFIGLRYFIIKMKVEEIIKIAKIAE